MIVNFISKEFVDVFIVLFYVYVYVCLIVVVFVYIYFFFFLMMVNCGIIKLMRSFMGDGFLKCWGIEGSI